MDVRALATAIWCLSKLAQDLSAHTFVPMLWRIRMHERSDVLRLMPSVKRMTAERKESGQCYRTLRARCLLNYS